MADEDILKKFNNHVSVTETQAALQDFKMFAPIIADMTMVIYSALLDKGFNKQQAFELAKDYIIAAATPQNK